MEFEMPQVSGFYFRPGQFPDLSRNSVGLNRKSPGISELPDIAPYLSVEQPHGEVTDILKLRVLRAGSGGLRLLGVRLLG